jgi:hypothetical protein
MVAGPAVAASSSGTPGWQVIQADGAGTVSAPVYGNLTPSQWMAQYLGPEMTANVPAGSSQITGDEAASLATSSQTELISAGNVDSGKLRVYGHTEYSQTNGLALHNYFASNASNNWYTVGTKIPINASMHWWLSGTVISFSLPVGAGFKSTGSGISWTPGQKTLAAVALNWSPAIQLDCQILYSANYTNQADMFAGGTWWHVQGS